MSEEPQTDILKMIDSLKRERDELRIKLHLGKAEVKQEFEALETKLTELNDRFKPAREAAEETAGHLWESLKLVGDEIRDGYTRIGKSL